MKPAVMHIAPTGSEQKPAIHAHSSDWSVGEQKPAIHAYSSDWK